MPTECEEFFFNRLLIVDGNEHHSSVEAQLDALGQSDRGRLMFVALTICGRLIRVISAHEMSRKERRIFRLS
jgi:uncharacterized protein